jgi:hypothetical protein
MLEIVEGKSDKDIRIYDAMRMLTRQDWCERRQFADGELVWENKAILFISDVVLQIRCVKPTKRSRQEAGRHKRKLAAARQLARRAKQRTSGERRTLHVDEEVQASGKGKERAVELPVTARERDHTIEGDDDVDGNDVEDEDGDEDEVEEGDIAHSATVEIIIISPPHKHALNYKLHRICMAL